MDQFVFFTTLNHLRFQEISENFDNLANLDDWNIKEQNQFSNWSLSTGVQFVSPSGSLLNNSTLSTYRTVAWRDVNQADLEVGAAIRLNTLTHAHVFGRGTDLNTNSPTYYRVRATRDATFIIQKVVSGTVSNISGASITTNSFFNTWAKVSLRLNGTNLRVQVIDPTNSRYLHSDGDWHVDQDYAINVQDSSITAKGGAGIGRDASAIGQLYFDDFSITSAAGDSTPPTVNITNPSNGATISGVEVVQATASDNIGVTKVEFYLDGTLRSTDTSSPFVWNFDTNTTSTGAHVIEARAYDAANNIGTTSINVTTTNDLQLIYPTIPQKMSHIRVAQFAYAGWVMGSFEEELLQNHIELVVAPTSSTSQITGVVTGLPMLAYTNSSNVYTNLLEDWLDFAETGNFDPEDGFYHAAKKTSFTGDSPSSQPVNKFWEIWENTTDRTNTLYNDGGNVTLGGSGNYLYIGHLDRYRELNVFLDNPASGGWTPTFEYVTGRDNNYTASGWTTLTLINDGTSGFTQSGIVTFDPPSGWVKARESTDTLLYNIRIGTLSASGTGPTISHIRGRDHVQANGTISGIIPVFDSSADLDGDRYLNDSEYANRASGSDARFYHETRLPAEYGQMRFPVNVGNSGLREWAVERHENIIGSVIYSGYFMDNSQGELNAFSQSNSLESIADYGIEYATMLQLISNNLSPQWILPNTVGGDTNADEVVKKVPTYFEEFRMRPMSNHINNFNDVYNEHHRRKVLTTPSPFAFIDSNTAGSTLGDPRLLLGTLCYYYMIPDDFSTNWLMYFAGDDPNGPWNEHWCEATTFDVGSPSGSRFTFETGIDPSDPTYTYTVLERQFDNARIFFKPRSRNDAGSVGTLGTGGQTTHDLSGNYRLLDASGITGGIVTSVILRNGEGAIAIPV